LGGPNAFNDSYALLRTNLLIIRSGDAESLRTVICIGSGAEIDQLFNSSEKRLARALLLLANFGKEGRPEPIIAKISQETLADMVGTTRSRVSFFMNKFRQLGFIEYNGNLVVNSSLLSVVLHDQPQIRSEPDDTPPQGPDMAEE